MSYLTNPTTFPEAVRKVGNKRIVASLLNSEDWQGIPNDVREACFFSARVNSARVLNRFKGLILDYLQQNRETITREDGSTVTKLKVGSRADFVNELQQSLIEEGFGDPLPAGQARGERGVIREVKDIASNRRLGLIFDTQMRQGYSFGALKVSLDPEIEEAFPAWRFVREGYVQEPRPVHKRFENTVQLKSDTEFWKRMNSEEIGGFGVPWGPWGFNSQMGVEEVSRTEAENMGLLRGQKRKKGRKKKNAGHPELKFNRNLKASTKSLSPDIVKKLVDSMGGRARLEGGKIVYEGGGS